MAVVIKDIKDIFPELCDVSDNVAEFWLNHVTDYLCQQSWGDCYDKAVLFLTAHEIALSLQRQASGSAAGGSAGGVVQSASADGLSVSYSVPDYMVNGTIDETQYAKTPYGQKYLQLRDSCLANGRLAGTVQDTVSDQYL